MKHRNKIYLTLCFALATVRAQQQEERNNRHFSLFSVVTFKNEECAAKSTSGMKGTCMSTSDCTSGGGTKDGNCASGFGVCCVHRVNTCGGTVKKNCSYIESPGYPTTYATSGACTYTVNRCQDNICQLRLDFFAVSLMQPNTATGATAGDCTNTILSITPGSTSQSITSKPPGLCGTLTGEHLYVDSGRVATAATVTFTLTSSSTTNTWRVKVSQIECNNPSRAPTGCLQYFTGKSRHTVKSFNWDGSKACTSGCLLSNAFYSVCFRPEKGMCGMYYAQSNVGSSLDAWDLPQLQDDTIDEEGDMETGANCINGYVAIVNTQVPYTNSGKFCGTGPFSPAAGAVKAAIVTAVESTAWTMDVVIHDDIEALQAGFSLDAQQVPC